MGGIELFPEDKKVGIFRGFQQGGLEFHADLVLPYQHDFQRVPMHGQFLLVQLESPEEAVLGRIASFSSEGKLSFGQGEDFNLRAMEESRDVPEDLRQQYLKYRVNIRVLGVLRKNGEELSFIASHRRLPHVGSHVAFLSDEVLREVAGHNIEGAHIGHLAFGEYIYFGGGSQPGFEDWMQSLNPEVKVHFSLDSLVSRRSFIFARAGFGKSNLNKLLFSELYKETPHTEKGAGKKVPVGTVIFDPDGEYFWPDDKGRPGLCDVPHLQDKLVVFTGRKPPSPYYGSFVAGDIKLDIRRLRPSDVIGIALSPDRQEQQNVRKLRGLPQPKWEELVDAIDGEGNSTDLGIICKLLELNPSRQEAEALAARGNMTTIVRSIHSRSSQLLDLLLRALREGKLCVIDVSQMRGGQSLILSGLILRRIFDRNQEEFTAAEPKTIPTIAVVEEAQSVLNERATSSEPYISWVKEGRKYDLGALLITQQPGSIPAEILSQGDNWFIFHLLSAGDLGAVKKANAHFSDDLLSSLLNEPIPGQGAFWSSVDGKAYPVGLRVLSFEKMYPTHDPKRNELAVETYARRLRQELDQPMAEIMGARDEEVGQGAASTAGEEPSAVLGEMEAEGEIDVKEQYEQEAIRKLMGDKKTMDWIESEDGAAWGGIMAALEKALPSTLDNRGDIAYYLVAKALTQIYGEQGKAWEAGPNPKSRTNAVYCKLLPGATRHAE